MRNQNESKKWLSPGFLALLLLLPVTCYAQEAGSCAEKLRNAQTLFERGQVEQVAGLLTDCMKSGFNREESLAAYKLIIQTYLFEDKLMEADSAMLSFLRKNPEYQISETDHSSFVFLYNNFNVRPVLMISLRAGTNFPFLTFVDENPTAGEPEISDFIADATNFYLSAEARVSISKKFEASMEVGYSQLEFKNTGPYMDLGEYSYTEYQKRLEIPLSLTFDILTFKQSFTPYIRAGVGASIDLSATADAAFYYNDRLNNDLTGGTLTRNDSRSFIDFVGQFGGGIRYKITRGYFFAEVRTSMGFLNQNVPGGETVGLLGHWYKWRDPDFRLNTLNFNVGWTYIFYKPSKR